MNERTFKDLISIPIPDASWLGEHIATIILVYHRPRAWIRNLRARRVVDPRTGRRELVRFSWTDGTEEHGYEAQGVRRGISLPLVIETARARIRNRKFVRQARKTKEAFEARMTREPGKR